MSKHVRLQREHLNTHDQTYTWFEIDLTAKTIRSGKKINIFLPHTCYYKMPGLDPQKSLHKTKKTNCIQNGKAIPPQNHNIKRFMEGVDPCHFNYRGKNSIHVNCLEIGNFP